MFSLKWGLNQHWALKYQRCGLLKLPGIKDVVTINHGHLTIKHRKLTKKNGYTYIYIYTYFVYISCDIHVYIYIDDIYIYYDLSIYLSI